MDDVFSTDVIDNYVNQYDIPSKYKNEEPVKDFYELVAEYIDEMKKTEDVSEDIIEVTSTPTEEVYNVENRDKRENRDNISEDKSVNASVEVSNDNVTSDVSSISGFDYFIFFGLIIMVVILFISKIRGGKK